MRDSIRSLIEEDRLLTLFQPILSISGKKIFGLEALSRGLALDGSIIPPLELFGRAKEEGVDLDLDARARQKAIERFLPRFHQNPHLLLFLNFESRLIDEIPLERYQFAKWLSEAGIPPKNIVLEVKEDAIEKSEHLEAFCLHFKNLGFNIALDDFGAGNSSFDRIALVRPDLIKIDKSLIRDVDKNYFHQQIIRAIANMGNNIGALVLAEGVESKEEALGCLKRGISLFQGFYFATPSQESCALSELHDKIERVGEALEASIRTKLQRRTELFYKAEEIISHIENLIHHTPAESWKERLLASPWLSLRLEAIYFLDMRGRQIGETIMLQETRSFFEPAQPESDHSLKEYFYLTKTALEKAHLTKRYISLASGNICRTYAKRVGKEREEMIICIDFREREGEETI